VKALVAALLATAALAPGAAGAAAPARLQVVAHEFSFTLSRQHVRAGLVTIELQNLGEDAHDLRLQRAGARHVSGLGVVQAGQVEDATLKLAPGRYSLWCSLGNHRQLGMVAALVVTPAR
jgi:plastocyanin